MRVVLDRPVSGRGYRVAALSRVDLVAHVGHTVAAGWAAKEPVAILIAGPGGMSAVDLTGRRLTRAEVERLCPGAWDGMTTRA
ncbi:MAG: hypothetical protein H6899_08985 [Rhodobacter sp.]|nr:hypothetical protein [Paracoccaceae bacterium]MCC0080063.1 hypothetical protein [Rhodobacter sp.]